MEVTGFSIITVSFNSAKTIRDTIESVLRQDYINYEYVIIDGGSTDETLSIITSYEQKFKEKGISYRWSSEKDNGIYDAMNKGLSIVANELVGIINSDDWYQSNILFDIAKFYEQNGKPDIVHGDLRMYTIEKELIEIRQPNLNYNKLWQGMTLKHPTFFVKRKVYNEIGLFSTDYLISSDYDFTLRVFLAGYTFSYCNMVVSNMRLGGISNTYRRASWKEVQIITKEYGLGFSKRKYFAIKRVLLWQVYKLIKYWR